MRILRIADVPDNRVGGMSRAMYGTGDVLASAGHQVDYLFAGSLQTPWAATLRRFMVPLELPFLVRQLMRQGQKYDVVEVHEPLAAPYSFLRQFFRRLPPLVIFSHGLEERSRLAELDYRKQKELTISFKKRYSPLLVVLQATYATRHCDQVICLNSQDREHLLLSEVSAEHVTQISNGIEEELLVAGGTAGSEGNKRNGILFVGSWLIRKGTLDLVPAITQVLQRHPELGFTAAGCGVDAETVKQDFPQYLHNQINIIPKFSGNKTLADLYKRHSIFVLPSYFEGHPLVMIEAAAFGMAIVTTGVCGMADFVQDGHNGLLVAVGESTSLGNAVERLVTDAALARSLGEAARATACEHTWARSARTTLRAYERAIHNASALTSGGRKKRLANL